MSKGKGFEDSTKIYLSGPKREFVFFLVRLIRGALRKTKKTKGVKNRNTAIRGESKKPTGNGISASPADEIHKHSKLNKSPPQKTKEGQRREVWRDGPGGEEEAKIVKIYFFAYMDRRRRKRGSDGAGKRRRKWRKRDNLDVGEEIASRSPPSFTSKKKKWGEMGTFFSSAAIVRKPRYRLRFFAGNGFQTFFMS